MVYDQDVRLIQDYILKNVPEPSTKDHEDLFELHAYSFIAAEEVLGRVIKEAMKIPAYLTGRPDVDVLDIVNGFVDEMDYYVHASESKDARRIFSIARDEGKCIMLYISGELERRQQ